MKLDDYDAVAGLARGTWYLTKLVLRRFMLRTGGRIVNISSVVGHTGNAGQIPYTMVKAGLDALTRSLAQELQGRDILVNSVAPGFIDTEMTAALPDEVRSRILERIPLGRMGRPEEVAEVVAFLATARSYVHRQRHPRQRGDVRWLSPSPPDRRPGARPAARSRSPSASSTRSWRSDDDHIVARYTFRPEADFYRGHFPGNPITPGVLLIEAMAQTGVVALGIYLVARERGVEEVRRVLTVFTDVTAEFSGVVRPGDTVTIRARKVFFRRMKLRAEVEMRKDDGSLVATATVGGNGDRGGARDGTARRVTGMGVVAPNGDRPRGLRRRAAGRAVRPAARAEARGAGLRLHGGRRAGGRRRDRGGLLRRRAAPGDELQPPLRLDRRGRRLDGRRASRAPIRRTTTCTGRRGR